MSRRVVVFAAALATVAASFILYRTRRWRSRKTPQRFATERWEGEGGATLPAGDTGYG